MAGIDIYNIETGNPIYNGSSILSIGAKGKDYFQYYRDGVLTTPDIAELEVKYSGDFDEVYYYNVTS